MSERTKDANARRKGKLAYRNGVLLEDNPMRAMDSRMNWEKAWRNEQRECEARERIFQRGRCIAECPTCSGPIYENQPCPCGQTGES